MKRPSNDLLLTVHGYFKQRTSVRVQDRVQVELIVNSPPFPSPTNRMLGVRLLEHRSTDLDVAGWQEEGYSLEQIRGRINDKYAEYGEPTDTPPLD